MEFLDYQNRKPSKIDDIKINWKNKIAHCSNAKDESTDSHIQKKNFDKGEHCGIFPFLNIFNIYVNSSHKPQKR